MSSAFAPTLDDLGEASLAFRCCDTDFHVTVAGLRAAHAAREAERTVRELERELNAFDERSAVSTLNRAGTVRNEHVARIVRRGLAYLDRTGGAFDIRQGRLEHDLKAFLGGERESLPDSFDAPSVTVEGSVVRSDGPLDLNGLAKGYIVDRAAERLAGIGRRGFVSGGGDLSPPTGPVAIDSPWDGDRPLKLLDTDWAVATSGGYRRHRDGTDHIYDPTAERLGARHESVTVLARRDCMEADALATTLAALPLADAIDLTESWPGLEALIVHGGVFHPTSGFSTHVLDA